VLTLTQVTANVQGSWAGYPLSGTLYPSGTLSLSTLEPGATTLTFSGRYTDLSGDGGQARYAGMLIASTDAADGGPPCAGSASFNAPRLP
jgi:hypothetical protein